MYSLNYDISAAKPDVPVQIRYTHVYNYDKVQ